MGIVQRLRLPAPVQDVLLAAFVVLFQVRGTIYLAGSQDAARSLAGPLGGGYALLAGTGLVLVVRRRWPVTVFAVTGAASLVYYAAGYPDGPGWIALFVALYTLTSLGDGHRALWVALGGGAALAAGWLLTAKLSPLLAAGWVFFRLGAGVMAAALGESVRGRRALAAEALERAERAEQLRDQEARYLMNAERLRIAREVHDTVAHAIAVINLHAGVTAHVLDERPEQVRESLGTIERTSATALRELRATLGLLRDAGDDEHAPAPGLGRLGELVAMARGSGLEVTVDAEDPPLELPGAVNHAAYRILQEAITNAVRHAGPAHLNVSVRCDDELQIRVADDGHGGPATGEPGRGRGITGMRERAALLGGNLTAGPRPGGGFEVCACLPLDRARLAAS